MVLDRAVTRRAFYAVAFSRSRAKRKFLRNCLLSAEYAGRPVNWQYIAARRAVFVRILESRGWDIENWYFGGGAVNFGEYDRFYFFFLSILIICIEARKNWKYRKCISRCWVFISRADSADVFRKLTSEAQTYNSVINAFFSKITSNVVFTGRICLAQWVFYEETADGGEGEESTIFLVAIKRLSESSKKTKIYDGNVILFCPNRLEPKIVRNGENETRVGKLVIGPN